MATAQPSPAVTRTQTALHGIRHRTKRTKDDEERPTMVALAIEGKTLIIELDSDMAEIAYINGVFPTKFRAITAEDDLKVIATSPLHVKWKKVKPNDPRLTSLPAANIKKVVEEKVELFFIAAKVASEFEGFRAGDTVATILGGSGNRFTYAVANKAAKLGGAVHRIPPFVLKNARDLFRSKADKKGLELNEKGPPEDALDGIVDEPEEKATVKGKKSKMFGPIKDLDDKLLAAMSRKDGDHLLTAHLFATEPNLFTLTRPRDIKMIRMTLDLRERMERMRMRIAAGQRIDAAARDQAYLEPDAYAGIDLEEAARQAKASNIGYQKLVELEAVSVAALEKSIAELEVFTQVASKVEGFGPKIAGRLLAAIGDIRRFETCYKFRAYCGVHVISLKKCEGCGFRGDVRAFGPKGNNKCPRCHSTNLVNAGGIFPRRRSGGVANWQPDARQAMYLVAEQFNRRPGTAWGMLFLYEKFKLFKQFPAPVMIEVGEGDKKRKVQRHSRGHNHRSAAWKTLTAFSDWLWGAWWDFEDGKPVRDFPQLPGDGTDDRREFEAWLQAEQDRKVENKRKKSDEVDEDEGAEPEATETEPSDGANDQAEELVTAEQ